MFQKLSCLPHVFGSVLACAKSAHLFQKLYYSLCRLCLSLSSLVTLPQTVRLFYVCVLRLPNNSTPCFSLMRRHGQSQTDLFTCTMVLHCGHTFLRRIEPIVSDVRVSSSMPVFVYRGHIYTLLQRICIKLSTEVS